MTLLLMLRAVRGGPAYDRRGPVTEMMRALGLRDLLIFPLTCLGFAGNDATEKRHGWSRAVAPVLEQDPSL